MTSRARFDNLAKVSKLAEQLQRNQGSFNLKEKIDFLNLLRQNGFGVIFDMEKLRATFPNRLDSEIKYMIDIYQKRSNSRMMYQKQSQEQFPLEKWQKLIDLNLPSYLKKNDFSFILVNILRKFASDLQQSTNGRPELANVYNYLADLAEGKYPPDLPPSSALVLLSIVEGLNDFTQKEIESEQIVSIILSLYEKNLKMFQTTRLEEELDQLDKDTLDYFQTKSKNQLQEELVKAKSLLLQSTNESIELQDKQTNPLFHYCNLSKIRRIRKCFNPLEVPVSLTGDQHEKVQGKKS